MRVAGIIRALAAAVAVLGASFGAVADTSYTFRQPLSLKCGVPGTVKACPFPNGMGQLVCTEQGGNGPCVLVACDAAFHAMNGTCVSDTQACVPANGAAGTQSWGGAGWGACMASACNAGFHIEGGACLADTRACAPANGSAGTQVWSGSGYGACVASACNAGYHLSGGGCVTNTQSCAVANGTGSQTWSNGAWGACTLSGCNSGYYPSGNACVAYTYAWQTSGWGGCSASPWWGDWGGCSANCGGGSQSRSCYGTDGSQGRSVWCQRNDGATVGDGYCGGGKPAASQSCSSSCSGPSSQSCNTQSCAPACAWNVGQVCTRTWCQGTGGASCNLWSITPSTCEAPRGGYITSCSDGGSICCAFPGDGRIQCDGSCQ